MYDTSVERTWRGLSLPRNSTFCHRCRKLLDIHMLQVLGSPSDWYHPDCAAYLGWVPSDSEAWALALYNSTTPPEGGH